MFATSIEISQHWVSSTEIEKSRRRLDDGSRNDVARTLPILFPSWNAHWIYRMFKSQSSGLHHVLSCFIPILRCWNSNVQWLEQACHFFLLVSMLRRVWAEGRPAGQKIVDLWGIQIWMKHKKLNTPQSIHIWGFLKMRVPQARWMVYTYVYIYIKYVYNHIYIYIYIIHNMHIYWNNVYIYIYIYTPLLFTNVYIYIYYVNKYMISG